jgi:hypothetical protein
MPFSINCLYWLNLSSGTGGRWEIFLYLFDEDIISSKCVEISGGNGGELFGKFLLKDRLRLDSVSQLLIDPARVARMPLDIGTIQFRVQTAKRHPRTD